MNNVLSNLTNNSAINIFGGIMFVLLGGITAFLANRHIAVFNDGVRPIVGQKKQGNLKYKALASMSFAMSIGYVIGFIPFSLAQNIIIMHTILLGSEMIGLVFKKNMKFSIIAAFTAMVYGGLLFWGLKYLNIGISKITYPGFGFDLGMIVDGAFPFLFSMFPVVATFIQFDWKKGLISFSISTFTYIIVALFGWQQAHLYPMAITLLVGTGLLFTFSFIDFQKNKHLNKTSSQISSKFELFKKNAKEIQKNKWYFVVSGSVASMVVASFASAPLVSMALQATTKQVGNVSSALIADTTWFIGFVPLVVLTALLTGVYSPVGLTLVFVWGDVAKIIGASIVQSTNNESLYFIGILCAGVMGGASLFLETYALVGIAKILTKVSSIQKISDAMRTGITKTIHYSFLIGGVVAAFVMGQKVAGLIGGSEAMKGLGFWLPSLGAGMVLIIVIMNSMLKRKIAEIAIAPLGAIIFGIIVNIIYFIGT